MKSELTTFEKQVIYAVFMAPKATMTALDGAIYRMRGKMIPAGRTLEVLWSLEKRGFVTGKLEYGVKIWRVTETGKPIAEAFPGIVEVENG